MTITRGLWGNVLIYQVLPASNVSAMNIVSWQRKLHMFCKFKILASAGAENHPWQFHSGLGLLCLLSSFLRSPFTDQCNAEAARCCNAADWAGARVQIRISGIVHISGCGSPYAAPRSAAAPSCAAALPSCGHVSVTFGEISAGWNQRSDACPHRCF